MPKIAFTFLKIAFSLPQFTAFFTDEDTTKPLNILHDIISKFDQLMYEAQFNRIEKIKIIQSTFMAACGLLSGKYNILVMIPIALHSF